MDRYIPRFDRWLSRQNASVRFGVYGLRVLLVLTALYLISRAVS